MALIAFLQLLTFAALVVLIVERRLTFVRPSRIADAFAVRLLADWQNDVALLSRDGVRRYVLHEYTQLCLHTGLPSSAAEAIADSVWTRVAAAQGLDDETAKPIEGIDFYV